MYPEENYTSAIHGRPVWQLRLRSSRRPCCESEYRLPSDLGSRRAPSIVAGLAQRKSQQKGPRQLGHRNRKFERGAAVRPAAVRSYTDVANTRYRATNREDVGRSRRRGWRSRRPYRPVDPSQRADSSRSPCFSGLVQPGPEKGRPFAPALCSPTASPPEMPARD